MEKYERALKNIPKQASASSFVKYVADSPSTKQQLFQMVKNGSADLLQIRFNLWRMTLGVIGVDSQIQTKIQQLKRSREEYKNKKSGALRGQVNQKQAKIPKNPLMMAMMKSPKVQETNDAKLRQDIRKDVERTYQQIEFFQDQNILKLLTIILLVWCKKNPSISYIQGMNEVLASVVYVYFMQVYVPERRPQNFQELNQKQQQVYTIFNSLQFCQSDIYSVFQKIMDIQKEMYRTEADSNLKGVINPNSKNNTPILQRIINLIDHKLKALDIQLFRIIKLQDVQTKTFLLRWIRCMHTREFSLENSFIIWDSIFLDYYEFPGSRQKFMFQFIDAMCLAMFIYMRSLALNRETAYQIQQIYQKYPSLKKGGYLEELISLAWSLCEALRNPSNDSASEQMGLQSSKIDKKLQFMKGRDQLVKSEKQLQPQSQLQNKKNSSTSPDRKVPEMKQEKLNKQLPIPLNNNNGIQKIEKKQAIEVKEVNNQAFEDDIFQVTLLPNQWKSLHNNIEEAIQHTTHQQARKQLQEALYLLTAKIDAAKIYNQ